MNNRIAKACRKAACPGISREKHGYCPAHAKLAGWGSYQQQNPNRIYNTARWRRTRNIVLHRDKGLCQNCLKQGRYISANHCDHIISIANGGSVWDIKNLQMLCKKCHEKKTAKEKRD
ncbi:TPA: HNH endonuclease [Photobacterium damselae]